MSLVRFVPLLLLAACATDPAAPGAPAEREEKIVCAMEEPTGSRMRVKRCWTQEQSEEQARDARSALDRGQTLRRPPPQQPGSSR